MKISNRLYKIYEQVSSGDAVADIGTDHGYVPILLLKNNISPSVILSDISDKSLSKAASNCILQGLGDDVRIKFRVGDGLKSIMHAEVDEIILAGIGGLLICNILEDDLEKTHSFKKIIMQPRNNNGALRYWLLTHGFKIDREVLSEEGKFICEIIVASPRCKNKFDTLNELTPNANMLSADDIRWKYPPSLTNCDQALLCKKIGWKIGSLNAEIKNLKKSKSDMSKKISMLEDDLSYLKSLIN